MTYTPPEGVSIGTFTADTLPASFNAPAGAVVSYKIYGTSAGAGVETGNLAPPLSKWEDGYIAANGWISSASDTSKERCSPKIPVEPNATYQWAYETGRFPSGTSGAWSGLGWYDDNDGFISRDSGVVNTDLEVVAPANAAYARLSFRTYGEEYNTMFIKSTATPASYIPYGYKLPMTVESREQSQDIPIYIGSTKLGAEEYVDYESGKIYKLQEGELTPTDPPANLPTITATGETTISSTETLGDIELTGDWLAIMGSTEDESIDIGFTVDAEEYIAFVTVDDGPSIQVSDTITIPSSASSFTLRVVSWGREQYTDTVYNALS